MFIFLLKKVKSYRCVILQKRKLREDMEADFKYQNDCHIVEGFDLFSLAPGSKSRTNGVKLQECKCIFDIRKTFLTMQ